MRMLPLLALFLVLPFACAHAASFDCRKASTRIEKTICGDKALSQADERLATAFANVLAVSLSPSTARAEQTEWLRARDAETDPGKLRDLYKRRIDALAALADKWRAARQDVDPATMGTTCVLSPESEPDTRCTVTAFGPLPGDADLRYQLQSYKDGELVMATGVVVLRPTGEHLTPVIAIGGTDQHFEAPDAFNSPFGRLLWVAGYMGGTGNFNAEHLYRYEKGEPVEVDVTSWLSDLSKRLPRGLGAWKGIYPNYRKFTATTALWQAGDGNCCPTGGRAALRFALDHDRLVLRDVTVVRGPKAAAGDN
jgi:uncharacterized protein